MPVSGTKPKPEGQRRRRNAPTFDWAEVENVPFDGEIPVELPDGLLDKTHAWWARVARMPHCVLWSETDWGFAADAAIVADMFYRNPTEKGEKALRDREKVMGTTVDYRRDLRIRYVEPAQVLPSEVTAIADYRAVAARHERSEEAT